MDMSLKKITPTHPQCHQLDPACRLARLRCRTYKIVPLAPTMGIIEWVNHATALKAVLRKGLASQRRAEEAAARAEAAAAASRSSDDVLFPSTRGTRRGAKEGVGVLVWSSGIGGLKFTQ